MLTTTAIYKYIELVIFTHNTGEKFYKLTSSLMNKISSKKLVSCFRVTWNDTNLKIYLSFRIM